MATQEYKLDAFNWLSIEKWTVENLFAFYTVNGKNYCKVCDEWFSPSQQESHCEAHVLEMQRLTHKRKKEAAKLALEARELRKEERRLEKEAMNESRT